MGEDPALASLLERHLPELRAFLRLRMGAVLRARESSADLAQSVCREILADRGEFEYRGDAAFKRWLYLQALRKLADRADHWRAERRDARKDQPLQEGASSGDAGDLPPPYQAFSSPSGKLAAKEEMARIERAFDELADDQREAVLLSRFGGLTYAEIAERMGKTESSVRMLLSRALARLTVVLERNEHRPGAKPSPE